MFHEEGIRETLKDTEKVPPLGEGQPMQPMDEQPLRPATNEPTNREQPAQETQTNQAATNLQESQLGQAEKTSRENQAQAENYRGASEQIPFSYPPASYQPDQSTPAQAGSVSAPPPGGPVWNYPPRPEQYQGGEVRPSTPVPEGSVTRPFGPPAVPSYHQPNTSFGQSHPQVTPLGSSYSAPTEPVAQPGLLAANQPGMVAQPRRSGLRTGALIGLAALLALVLAIGLFAGWQFGRTGGSALSPSSSSSLQPSNNSNVNVPQLTDNNVDVVREAVISKVQPAIVQLNVASPGQQALGSGVIIDKRGYIITNNHVVSGATTIQVTLSNNTVLPAKVVGVDPVDDLAVIKITPPASGLTTVNPGDSGKLVVGQGVLAIGSPLGNTETVTSGIVSALNRNVSEGQNGPILPDAIQTDAPINPGNSGGALVDMQGNLVGMPTLNAIDTEFNTPANGLGFAIPVNRIQFIAQQIIADGHVTHTGRSILGVTVTNVNQQIAAQNHLSVTSGVMVVNVTSSGPAASAGMKAGDVIVQLGNKIVNSTTNLSSALLPHKPGDSVAVKIYRGSQQLTLNVSLGELPAS